MTTRRDRGFRFPMDKYEEEIALYTNFRYLENYLDFIRKKDIYGFTVIVAAADSNNPERAHYRCDGASDEEEINAAINDAEENGGTVVLLEGTYNIEDQIFVAPQIGTTVRILGHGATLSLNGSPAQITVPSSGGNGTLIIEGIVFTGTTDNCIKSISGAGGGNPPVFCLVIGCTFHEVTANRCITTIDLSSQGVFIVANNVFNECTIADHYIGASGGSRVGQFLVEANSWHDSSGTILENTHGATYAVGNFVLNHTGTFNSGGTVIASHNVVNGVMVGGDHTGVDHGSLTGLADDDHTQYVLRNILTTRGDLFSRGAAVIQRLALGTTGQFLRSDGTDPVWDTVILNDIDDVDISSPADGDVLTYDSGSGDWLALPVGAGTLDLDDLNDVVITSPADGDVLVYDSASGDWINNAGGGGGASALDDLTDVAITSPADHDIIAYDSASGDWLNRIPHTFGPWPAFGDEFIIWDGDAAGMTTVTVTGSQSITELIHSLSVDYEDQAANDMNCLLVAHTFSVGDSFVVPVRLWSKSAENFSMAVILFTDGTTSTSNAVSTMTYYQASGTVGIHQMWNGTLTNMANGSATLGANPTTAPGVVYLRLTYTAANSFTGSWSPDGISWIVTQNQTPTITPTHIGVGWSAWNAASTNDFRIATFGPIRKIA